MAKAFQMFIVADGLFLQTQLCATGVKLLPRRLVLSCTPVSVPSCPWY